MTYRDDLEASQARVTALERQLSEARAELEERDQAGQALVRLGPQALDRGTAGSPAARTWFGAPVRLEFERELDGELPESAYTAIVERIRTALGNVGTVSILPGSLAWTATSQSNGVGPFVNVYLTMRDGTTTLRAEERLGNLAGAIFGGVGGGVGGGGLMIPVAAAMVSPLLLPVTIPLWLGGVYAACRRIYRGRARSRAARLETLIDDLERIAADHLARADKSEKQGD